MVLYSTIIWYCIVPPPPPTLPPRAKFNKNQNAAISKNCEHIKNYVFFHFLIRVKELVNSDCRFGFYAKTCVCSQLDMSGIQKFDPRVQTGTSIEVVSLPLVCVCVFFFFFSIFRLRIRILQVHICIYVTWAVI